MKVIGLDTSMTDTGVSDGVTAWSVTSDVPLFEGKKRDRRKGHPAPTLAERRVRLALLSEQIVLGCVHADLVVIEQPSYAAGAGAGYFDRAGLWWLVMDDLIGAGIPVAEVVSSSLKKYATGKGKLDGKGAMIDAAARRLPAVEHGGNDNQVDALWLAAMGYDHLGEPLCPMPAVNRETLKVVRWP